MKSRLFYFPIILFILSFAIFSCNNANEPKIEESTTDTLKSQVENRQKEITWTKELEANRLSSSLQYKNQIINNNISITRNLLNVVQNVNLPVYPELSGFSSLDTSLLPKSVRDNVESFCLAFSKNPFKGAESYFNSDYLFNFVFFRNDLITLWKTNFGTDFPLTQEDDSEGEAENNLQLFDKWIFGQPFLGEEIIQLPVRFYCKDGTIDVKIYINRLKSNTINQICIEKWSRV